MTERWLPVVGFEGMYEVSNKGRVHSRGRYIKLGHPGSVPRWQPGRILRPDLVRKKYHQVTLCNNTSRTARRIHCLVLEAFVGPCPDGLECCHNNGVSTDNRLENLRWDTRLSNAADQLRHGTQRNAFRMYCVHGHKFTDDNTYHLIQNGRPRRMCKQCCRDRDAARRQARREMETA